MSKHRGHEQHEIEDISDVVHDFSDLPDSILHHILSFIPTTEAVKTSILSTRWKNLWTFLPSIDIDDELLCAREVYDVTSFVNFVERVLLLWDASNMEKFRISCHVLCNSSIIRSWISHAIMHNVQELDICLVQGDPYVIPQSIFDSTSLVSLKIRMNWDILLPSHVSFPCLKTLHLSFLWFLHDDFTEKIFPGCPALEELVLFKCCFRNSKNTVISSSTLKNLTIHDLSRFQPYDDTSGCKIKIDAANLTYFEYIGFLSNEIIFNDTSSLNKSFIDIPNPGERLNKVACRAIDLLKQLQYVASLQFSNQIFKLYNLFVSMRDLCASCAACTLVRQFNLVIDAYMHLELPQDSDLEELSWL
ncbi:hypothetical protein L2E82_25992 [Cichorium intybus]|uniref:Uncharacterized protein n=1 Tax=Cichorium intybus TaxID=13427 RepID=A0ACB9E632_CICIN|nr:hypothetical protein L2E82_25992 [Cichorium intybus]